MNDSRETTVAALVWLFVMFALAHRFPQYFRNVLLIRLNYNDPSIATVTPDQLGSGDAAFYSAPANTHGTRRF